jgi:hypothetical protein
MRPSGDRSTDRRVTVPEAAAILNITPDAVRSRLRRGTLCKDQAPDGTVLVVLDGDGLSDRPTDQTTVAYINALKSQIETLTSELGAWKNEVEGWKEESRRKDTIMMSLTQRIPELGPAREAPLEARESPENVDETGERVNPPPSEEPHEEATQRPWYQRWFGS